jgi:hypothetical protein
MTEANCYLESFPHVLPHRDEAKQRPCGHWACDPHTITYYGTGDDSADEGEYCMVCYSQKFPNLCPDPLLRSALAQAAHSG